MPSEAELMADLRALFLADAAAVRDGLYPPEEPAVSLAEHLRDVRAMFADLPATLRAPQDGGHAQRRRNSRAPTACPTTTRRISTSRPAAT